MISKTFCFNFEKLQFIKLVLVSHTTLFVLLNIPVVPKRSLIFEVLNFDDLMGTGAFNRSLISCSLFKILLRKFKTKLSSWSCLFFLYFIFWSIFSSTNFHSLIEQFLVFYFLTYFLSTDMRVHKWNFHTWLRSLG